LAGHWAVNRAGGRGQKTSTRRKSAVNRRQGSERFPQGAFVHDAPSSSASLSAAAAALGPHRPCSSTPRSRIMRPRFRVVCYASSAVALVEIASARPAAAASWQLAAVDADHACSSSVHHLFSVFVRF